MTTKQSTTTGTRSAQHYSFTGKGVEGELDLTSLKGTPIVSLTVDGTSIEGVSIAETERGIQLSGQVGAIPDLETEQIDLTIPHVNLSAGTDTFAGFAVLTTERTSIGGPRLVDGPLQAYELRPVAGLASFAVA